MRSIAVAIVIVCLSLYAAAGHAQAAAQTSMAPPEFEVATIKLSKELTANDSGIHTGSGQLSAKNVTLKRCILGAYGIGPHQILGGPDWINTTRFDIEAKGDPSIDTDEILNQMTQRLLAERFGLRLHREQKTMRAYSLEVSKDGLKIATVGDGESNTSSSSTNTMKLLDAGHVSMDLLARVLARDTPLPIVNNTGLDGLYTFKLRWTPDNARQPDSKAEDYGTLPDAIREQLGLQLRVTTIPVDSLVIDDVQMPTDN